MVDVHWELLQATIRPTEPPDLPLEMSSSLWGEGLVWLITVLICLVAANIIAMSQDYGSLQFFIAIVFVVAQSCTTLVVTVMTKKYFFDEILTILHILE